jgi:hypothetical protein
MERSGIIPFPAQIYLVKSNTYKTDFERGNCFLSFFVQNRFTQNNYAQIIHKQ